MANEIVRPRKLLPLTGLSRTTIWRLEKEGKFPKRIRLSRGAVGYRLSDILVWQAGRLAVGEGEEG